MRVGNRRFIPENIFEPPENGRKPRMSLMTMRFPPKPSATKVFAMWPRHHDQPVNRRCHRDSSWRWESRCCWQIAACPAAGRRETFRPGSQTNPRAPSRAADNTASKHSGHANSKRGNPSSRRCRSSPRVEPGCFRRDAPPARSRPASDRGPRHPRDAGHSPPPEPFARKNLRIARGFPAFSKR
jgi:hypothetical protein